MKPMREAFRSVLRFGAAESLLIRTRLRPLRNASVNGRAKADTCLESAGQAVCIA
jgi:hypothetical protein